MLGCRSSSDSASLPDSRTGCCTTPWRGVIGSRAPQSARDDSETQRPAMNVRDSVLVVIGQIGAGKSEVCRLLARSLSARHLAIEDVRRSERCGNDANRHRGTGCFVGGRSRWFCSSVPVRQGTSRRSSKTSVCADAARSSCCSIATRERRCVAFAKGLFRHLGRADRGLSRFVGPNRDCALVPADLALSSETASPTALASTIVREWETMLRDQDELRMVRSDVSFSQLAAFQVCPLSYPAQIR